VAYARTFQQVLAVSNLGAIFLAALGGALSPYSTLPGWAKAISPATPTYWAMKAFNDVLLKGEGFRSVAVSVAVLVGAAGLFLALASARFRFDAEKGGTVL
jgi:ABC-2 type transport system permease protein